MEVEIMCHHHVHCQNGVLCGICVTAELSLLARLHIVPTHSVGGPD